MDVWHSPWQRFRWWPQVDASALPLSTTPIRQQLDCACREKRSGYLIATRTQSVPERSLIFLDALPGNALKDCDTHILCTDDLG